MHVCGLPFPNQGREWTVYSKEPVVILEGVYDALQLWLPFVECILFKTEVPQARDIDKEHEQSLQKIKNGLNRKYAVNSEADRYVYLWEKHVHQRMLPFKEHRMISHKHFARLQKAGFPGWDRTESGNLIEIAAGEQTERGYMSHTRRFAIENWCELSTHGCYHITQGARAVIFERQHDAMLFKLTYC